MSKKALKSKRLFILSMLDTGSCQWNALYLVGKDLFLYSLYVC